MTSTDYEVARAEGATIAGATWLDRTLPEWWRLLDLDYLDVSSEHHCVLGQLAGPLHDVLGRARPLPGASPYAAAAYAVRTAQPYASASWNDVLGFSASTRRGCADYAALTAAWKDRVRERAVRETEHAGVA